MEVQQPDWAQTEFCEELKEQQQSDTIHLLTYKQPEETRIAWNYHTEEHMDYIQVCSVVLSSRDYISPSHLFNISKTWKKTLRFQQPPPRDA